MAIAKVILNGETLMDTTQKTVTANTMLDGTTALKNDGTGITGNIASKSSSDLTASGATVTAPAGYYPSAASKSVASGSATTPATSITANPTISVNASGLITASVSSSQSVTPSVSAGYVSSGTAGTVSVSGSKTQQLTTQAAKTVAPTESEQTAVTSGVYTTGAVKVGAISSTYVGSDIAQNDSDDLTASGATITVPAGYYAETASKSVTTTTHPNPTASVNSATGLVTASHTQGTGYVTGGTTTGTMQLSTQAAATITPSTSQQTAVAAGKYTTGAVTVDPIPSQYIIPSGTKEITENGEGIDVSAYAAVDVAVPSSAPNLQEKTVTPSDQTQVITADGDAVDVLASLNNINGGPNGVWNISWAEIPVVGEVYHITLNGTRAYRDRTYSFDDDVEWTGFPFSFDPTVTPKGYGIESFSINSTNTITHGVSSDEEEAFFLSFSFEKRTPGYDALSKVTVNPIPSAYIIPSGTKEITANGEGIDVSAYASVDVAVPAGIFVIEVEQNSTTGYWEPDKTFSEIQAAYTSGKKIVITSSDESYKVSGRYVEGDEYYSTGWYYGVNWYTNDNRYYINYYILDSTGITNDGGMELINRPSDTIQITQNGTVDVTQYASAEVNVSGDVTPVTVEESDVNFIDYDGTILYSYTASDFANLSALPSNPSHAGLTAQGWNWSLSDAKTYVAQHGKLWIGQMYITSDGKTRIYITLGNPNFLSPYLAIAVNGTVVVDWGDNTSTDTVTGASNTTLKYTLHEYASTGDYVIAITVTSGSFSFYGTDSLASLLRVVASGAEPARNRIYSSSITHIRLGSQMSLGQYALHNCQGIKSITMPSSITSIGNYAFRNCYSLISLTFSPGLTGTGNSLFRACYNLTSVAIPNTVTTIGVYFVADCISLSSITLPNSVTAIDGYAFNSCYNLSTIEMPSGSVTFGNYAFYNCVLITDLPIVYGATAIPTYMFGYCYALKSITIPASITSIASGAFAYCYFVKEYHFLSTTPPTLANTNAFNGIRSDTKIYVPYSADHSVLEAYKTATNWSTYASRMEEEPQ